MRRIPVLLNWRLDVLMGNVTFAICMRMSPFGWFHWNSLRRICRKSKGKRVIIPAFRSDTQAIHPHCPQFSELPYLLILNITDTGKHGDRLAPQKSQAFIGGREWCTLADGHGGRIMRRIPVLLSWRRDVLMGNVGKVFNQSFHFHVLFFFALRLPVSFPDLLI